MTPHYLNNLRIVWAQPFWYTVGWGLALIGCWYAAYLSFRYMFNPNKRDPISGTVTCVISCVLVMLSVPPLLMVVAKIHAYLLFQ